ncbi:MAG: NUDIX hydrolase [Pseudomonadota bacterium]
MATRDLNWTLLSSKSGPDLPLFTVRLDTMQHPLSGEAFERMVLETSDWVNVVAVTAEQKVIMVQQYRFGVGALTLEPPAGLVDAGEESLDAAKRELLEETGYGGGQWSSLGRVQANPAIHNNFCHLWLAENVSYMQDPAPDPGEAIAVKLMSPDEVRAAVAENEILHPLGLAALSRVFPLWECPFQPTP